MTKREQQEINQTVSQGDEKLSDSEKLAIVGKLKEVIKAGEGLTVTYGGLALYIYDNFISQQLAEKDGEIAKLKADSQRRVEGIFAVGDKFIEMIDHADFSNGNTANGVDEGDVLAYRIIEGLKSDWQSLKSREGVQ